MSNETEWERFQKETHLSQYDYILEEINRLFERQKHDILQKKIKKNLELIRIFLPEKDFKFLEEYPPFKKLHSLGGIPCVKIAESKIRIDSEIVNPRKRKRRAIVYVKPEKERET